MTLALIFFFFKGVAKTNLFRIFSLELNMDLPAGPEGSVVGTPSEASHEQDELSQRLARLRQAE